MVRGKPVRPFSVRHLLSEHRLGAWFGASHRMGELESPGRLGRLLSLLLPREFRVLHRPGVAIRLSFQIGRAHV